MIGTKFPGATDNEAAYPAFENLAAGDYCRLQADNQLHKLLPLDGPDNIGNIKEPAAQVLAPAMAGKPCRAKFLNRDVAP
jgi:hypothetical protein